MEEEQDLCRLAFFPGLRSLKFRQHHMRYLIVIFILPSIITCAQLPLIVRETFDKNIYGWYENETVSHKVMFHRGKYLIEAPEGGWLTCTTPYVENGKDFLLEATFTQLDGEDTHSIGFL